MDYESGTLSSCRDIQVSEMSVVLKGTIDYRATIGGHIFTAIVELTSKDDVYVEIGPSGPPILVVEAPNGKKQKHAMMELLQ